MAELHTLPGGSTPPPEDTPAAGPIIVGGWDGQDAPAVVVNATATKEQLVRWAAGQLRQVNRLLAIVGCMRAQDAGLMELDEFAGCIRQFTEQAEQVLQAALARS